MMELVPYGFERDVLPSSDGRVLPGHVQGVYITLHPDALEEIAEKIARWFAGRDEVEIVDHGTSDKQGFGFVLMEWIEHEIDPLFLAILREEEMVGDYTLYGRVLLEE